MVAQRRESPRVGSEYDTSTPLYEQQRKGWDKHSKGTYPKIPMKRGGRQGLRLGKGRNKDHNLKGTRRKTYPKETTYTNLIFNHSPSMKNESPRQSSKANTKPREKEDSEESLDVRKVCSLIGIARKVISANVVEEKENL
jgi:hypothetical protein